MLFRKIIIGKTNILNNKFSSISLINGTVNNCKNNTNINTHLVTKHESDQKQITNSKKTSNHIRIMNFKSAIYKYENKSNTQLSNHFILTDKMIG